MMMPGFLPFLEALKSLDVPLTVCRVIYQLKERRLREMGDERPVQI